MTWFKLPPLRPLICALALGGVATPAAAFEMAYFMSVHQQDLFNSSGTRLTDPCAILRQDRANYHRFGKAGQGDQGDLLFGTAEARGAFGGDCAPYPGYDTARMKRGEAYIRVLVIGKPGGGYAIRFGEGAG